MIKVLIADDDALVRAGLAMILASDEEIMVVGEAADGEDALRSIEARSPDVVLMDIRMPRMDGLTALEQMRSHDSETAVIMLTTFDTERYILRALRAGADGFLLKDIPPRELMAAVHKVAAGDPMLAPSVTARLIDHVAARSDNTAAAALMDTLTPREREVAEAIGAGESNAEISTRLHMSQPTVKTYVSRILAKLHYSNRVQVAILVHEASR